MYTGVHLKWLVLELLYLNIATTYTNKCYMGDTGSSDPQGGRQ